MRFEDVKAALQPTVEQDLQLVYDAFVAENDKADVEAFLSHLVSNGVIDEETRSSIARDLSGSLVDPVAEAPAPPEEGESAPKRPRRAGAESGARRRRRKEGFATGAQDMGASGTGARRRRSATTGSGAKKSKLPPAPPPNTALTAIERYDFIGSVGAGAMGQVHLAKDKLLHRKVAFKQITTQMAKHGTMASKFQMEAQITAQLDHPNIVAVYTLETSPDGMAAYTMKLVKGATLEDLIVEGLELHSKRKPVPESLTQERLLEHFLKVCDAMSYAHSRGVVHRDLKPENIMVGRYGEIYVMDWGISRPFTQDIEEPVEVGELEDEGELVIGTPQYMSPEQATGNTSSLDHRSDQYALGLILFELISFNQAVTGKTPMKIVMRQQDGDKNRLVHVNRRVLIAPELKAIVGKATALKTEHRYDNVAELAEDVRRYMRGESVRAKRDTPPQALMRFMRRHQRITLAFIFLLITGSIFSLLVVAGAYQWRLSQQRVREGLVSQLITTVNAQSSKIDGQFLKYEGLLSVLVVTATDLLERGGSSDRPAYFDDDFAPPDLHHSERYGMEISLEHPVLVVSRGVDPSTVRASIDKLLPMQRHYSQVMLRSLNEDAAVMGPSRARRAISEVGVPLAWTYTATTDGVYASYPGHTGYPASFDARSRPWYELAEQATGPTWGAPHGDVSGMGLILSCAQSLRTSDGALLGVTGLDVTFDFLIEELLEIDGFTEFSEAFLLDEQGRIVVQSSRKGQKVSSTGREMRLASFPVDEVVQDIERLRSGYVEQGQEIIVYNRMNSLGWYYVVQGETGAMLEQIADNE